MSIRGLANILSSYAVDIRFVTKDDLRFLVDQNKVSRDQEREMLRLKKNAETWLRTSGMDGIQFDEKEEAAKA